jgi:hypothetical protein
MPGERAGEGGLIEPLRLAEFQLDTESANQKYAARRNDPRRTKTGTFKVPRDASMGQYEGITRESCNKFVDMLDKQGWTLVSKLQVGGPFTAHDLDTSIILLDRHEYRVQGLFQFRDPKPTRIEIPSKLVRGSTEQRLTLKEALNA